MVRQCRCKPFVDALLVLRAIHKMDGAVEYGLLVRLQMVFRSDAIEIEVRRDHQNIGIVQERNLYEADAGLRDRACSDDPDMGASSIKHGENVSRRALVHIKTDLGMETVKLAQGRWQKHPDG